MGFVHLSYEGFPCTVKYRQPIRLRMKDQRKMKIIQTRAQFAFCEIALITEIGQQNLQLNLLLARAKVKTCAKLAACSILDMKKLLFDSFRKNRLHYNCSTQVASFFIERLCKEDY